MDVQVLQFDARVGMGTYAPWLKELGCQIHCCRCDLGTPPVGTNGPLLLLGGYMGVNDQNFFPYLKIVSTWIAEEVRRERPILAICLGGQLLAHSLGGAVSSQSKQEKGIQYITLTHEGNADPLFEDLPETFVSFEWHNDSFEIPAGATHVAQTESCHGQAFRYSNAWGLQFHPEVNEQIVAEWCELTGSGKEHVDQFLCHRETYFYHSKQILEILFGYVNLFTYGNNNIISVHAVISGLKYKKSGLFSRSETRLSCLLRTRGFPSSGYPKLASTLDSSDFADRELRKD